MAGARLRWGTSSFSEKSWVGSFYPAGTPPRDMLAVYATRFDAVEVDATYYAVPDERVVRGWERKVPDGFTLCAKVPRTAVHAGERSTPDPERVLVSDEGRRDAALLVERLRLLGPKCGPLVLQFPWFPRRAPLALDTFLERLDRFLAELPGDLRYAVEVRNRDWLGEPLLALLRARRVALVLSEVAGMPHPAEVARRLDPWTADFAYARLIGDRRAVDRLTDSFDRVVLDKEADLLRWSELLRASRERVPETYVFANNHYQGHGPATVRRLRELVEGDGS